MENAIKFQQEASNWNEALPIGNGTLGAMVFGGVREERIQLNEDSLWSGSYKNRVNPDAAGNYLKVRELLQQGEIGRAEKLAARTMYATSPHMSHYQTLGDIWLKFFDQEGEELSTREAELTDYIRKLDLNESIGCVSYNLDKINYKREFYASYPNSVLVYRLSAEKNTINVEISATRKENISGLGASYCDGTEIIENNKIRLHGRQSGDKGLQFELLIKVDSEGGRQYHQGSHIIVDSAETVVLYITARTSYRSKNPLEWCKNVLTNLSLQNYALIKENHIRDYKNLYNRCSLELFDDNNYDNLSTPERLKNMRNGLVDKGLLNIYYNYARYLLISCSRENSLPANLQGIWNKDFAPSWGSKYTININTEMNYWLVEKSNLSSLHLPLLEHIRKMYPHGCEVAEQMYGLDGFCCHHNTDIWGDCAPQDNCISSTLWPMGGAWLALHILEHYFYTKDKDFLKSYYDILESTISFFIHYMFKDENGNYITGPSLSPENKYICEGRVASLCLGATMDREIIAKLFQEYLEASRDGGYESSLIKTVERYLALLPEIKIGRHGQIQEWMKDYEEYEPGHRHMSQLFALYPAQTIRFDQNEKLIKACYRTIQRRLKNGSGHTGWSKAWIINFYAHLKDAENAWKNLVELLCGATLDNLLDNHPPFQIDGNFGGANGLLEMIIQDYNDSVYLLPALPKNVSGTLSGYVLRQGAEISFKWEKGQAENINIIAKRECSFDLYINEVKQTIQLIKGEQINL